MFPEHRDLISQLRQSDMHFKRLFDQHNALDHKIKNSESGVEAKTDLEVETMKKEKLKIKDSIYEIILKKKKEV